MTIACQLMSFHELEPPASSHSSRRGRRSLLIAIVASRKGRRHEYDNGLAYHGPGCTAVYCHLGRMMAAMMFPTAAPMILTFHKVQAGKRQRGYAFVSTWVFVAVLSENSIWPRFAS